LDRLVRTIQPDLVPRRISPAAIFSTASRHNARWPKDDCDVSRRLVPGDDRLEDADSEAGRKLGGSGAFDPSACVTEDDRPKDLGAAAPGAVVHRLPSCGLGCDLENSSPLGFAERAALRAKLAVQPEEIVFTFVRSFCRVQGFRGRPSRALLENSRPAMPNAPGLLLMRRCRPAPFHWPRPHEAEQLKASAAVIHAGFSAQMLNACLPARGCEWCSQPARRDSGPA